MTLRAKEACTARSNGSESQIATIRREFAAQASGVRCARLRSHLIVVLCGIVLATLFALRGAAPANLLRQLQRARGQSWPDIDELRHGHDKYSLLF